MAVRTDEHAEQGSSPSRLVAKVVTEVFSPAVVVIALPIVVAWHATGGRIWPALGWGLLVALFSSILPMVFIISGARRGKWDGHHVRNREGRLLPLSLGLGSTAIGLIILLAGHAPRDVVALDLAMLATLFVCLIITRWWKISLHVAVAGGATATLVVLYGPVLLAFVAVVALVAWSRVKLADHTLMQVIAGALVGPLVGGFIFLSVR
jgi:membrane-associated phospholipid phosphatase